MAAAAEQTAVSFSVLTGSVEQGNKTLGELRQFAASTPFQFPEIADSAKKLIAFGISSDEVTGELRKLGDVSAGLGIPMNELADMYGKARVSGRLFGEDLNQWAGRGVNLTAEFANSLGLLRAKSRIWSHLAKSISPSATGHHRPHQ
ncbi:MAG: tape measure protein [Planctomycetaceae bacterium]